MAEYIEREALIKRLEVTPLLRFGIPSIVRDGVIDLAKKQPAADVVEVVRCKDCKYWNWFGGESHKGICDKCDCLMYDDDFCSYGERRSE